ncbi:MAG: hypothetical protein EON58_06835 [Alphaproteobacteria bacterium]|nr:MAG: hypothetical protein EON58_06835 [Alphaproteobacteria bacterium]
MNKPLSDADRRVISLLRDSRRKCATVSRECFASRNVRPAAAHLVRMRDRGLVVEQDGWWSLSEAMKEEGPELGL